MRLRRLQIERFRGIYSLDWRIVSPVTCLVGPNDSGKTTILDAIELVLWPRWSAAFDDADFYKADTTQPIKIKATLGALPEGMTREDRFGLHLQGWPPIEATNTTPEKAVEPDDAHADIVVIQLTVQADLEPKWVVVDSKGEETPIGYKDRERLGMARIGALLDRHLGWGRGSVLSRLTGESDEIGSQLANAGRAARSVIQADQLPQLTAAARKAETAAKAVGVKPAVGYGPRLDLGTISMTSGVFTLHDGDIPLRRAGEGSRRLLTLAMQREVAAANKGGVTLVDEVEHGLEPFRLRQVLRVLRGRLADTSRSLVESQNGDQHESEQIIMSTHSPIAIAELEPAEIGIVRRDHSTGTVVVRTVEPDLRQAIRGVPDALVSPKVLLCEGKTEIGFLLSLDAKWTEETGASFAYLGVALVDGGGKQLPPRALALMHLGFQVVCLLDSDDKTVDPEIRQLSSAGATIIRWADDLSIEERLAKDLPWDGVVEMVLLAAQEREPASLADTVSARVAEALGDSPRVALGPNPREWKNAHADEGSLRVAIGQAAKQKAKPWFKRVDLGENLGVLVLKYLGDVASKDLGKKVALLKKAIHGV